MFEIAALVRFAHAPISFFS